jgi:hypothetical protein
VCVLLVKNNVEGIPGWLKWRSEGSGAHLAIACSQVQLVFAVLRMTTSSIRLHFCSFLVLVKVFHFLRVSKCSTVYAVGLVPQPVKGFVVTLPR